MLYKVYGLNRPISQDTIIYLLVCDTSAMEQFIIALLSVCVIRKIIQRVHVCTSSLGLPVEFGLFSALKIR